MLFGHMPALPAYLMRNASAYAGKGSRCVVAVLIATNFA